VFGDSAVEAPPSDDGGDTFQASAIEEQAPPDAGGETGGQVEISEPEPQAAGDSAADTVVVAEQSAQQPLGSVDSQSEGSQADPAPVAGAAEEASTGDGSEAQPAPFIEAGRFDSLRKSQQAESANDVSFWALLAMFVAAFVVVSMILLVAWSVRHNQFNRKE
jgi:hypothetical protein